MKGIGRTVGETIKKKRKTYKMTQAKLARKLKVSRRTIIRWEQDIMCAHWEILYAWKLGVVFNCSVFAFLRKDNPTDYTFLIEELLSYYDSQPPYMRIPKGDTTQHSWRAYKNKTKKEGINADGISAFMWRRALEDQALGK